MYPISSYPNQSGRHRDAAPYWRYEGIGGQIAWARIESLRDMYPSVKSKTEKKHENLENVTFIPKIKRSR